MSVCETKLKGRGSWVGSFTLGMEWGEGIISVWVGGGMGPVSNVCFHI